MPSKLGGLPDLQYGPVLLEQQDVPHNDRAGAIWDEIANAAEDIGKRFQPALNDVAAKRGAAAVTRDANGNLQYSGDMLPISEAAQAYNNAAQLAYMSQASMDVRAHIAELQQKFANDPAGFKASLDGLVTGHTANAPPDFQGPLQDMILKQGAAAYDGLINDKLRNDAKKNQETVDAAITANQNELFAYARQGKLDDPRAVDLINEIQNQIRAKAGNPAFAYAPAQAEQDIAELQGSLRAEAILGHVAQDYAAYGEAGAEERLQKLINDPSLQLTDAERTTLTSRGLSEIRTLHAAQSNDLRDLQMDLNERLDDAYAAALATGDYSSVTNAEEIRRTYANKPGRAEQILGRLNGAAEIHSMNIAVGSATPAQLAAMEQKYRPTASNLGAVGANAPPAGSVAANNLAHHNPGNLRKPGAKEFQSFASDAEGVAAVDHQLGLYIKRGVNTISDIVSTYAPPSDNNNTPAYIASVAQQTGLDPFAPVTADDIPKIRDAMLRVEQGGTPTTHPDVANQLRVYNAFHEAVAHRNQLLASDPAGFVLAGHQDIAAMISANDPVVVQKGIKRLLSVEADLGSPTSTILSKGQITGIIAQFNNAPDPTKKAQQMIQTIATLQQRFGSFYPQVMGQLVKAGLPSDAFALDWVKDDPVTASRMANAVNTGRDTLAKLVPDAGDVNKNVLAAMADFNGTTHGFGGSQVQAGIVQAAQLYAYQLVSEGVDPTTAASQAVHDLANKHYNFQDGYRVPQGIDAGVVSSGASAFLDGLSDKNIEPYGAADPGATVEDRRRMAANVLKSQGVWTTLPDDSGLALTWPASTGYLQARDANNRPIRFSWAQLSAMANTRSAGAGLNWSAFGSSGAQ